MLSVLLHASTHAADVNEHDPETEHLPGVEFLEFLGEWETEQGEWIDPQEMDDDYLASQIEDSNAIGEYE